MHLPRASSPATKTTPQRKPTTMRGSSLATLLLRHRGSRRSSPCLASALPSDGGPGLPGGPALGNRQASPAPLAAASAPVPRRHQQQQQQSQPRAPPQTTHPVSSWQQWQQQQPARQAPPMPSTPSFAPPPPQQQQQRQGAWSPSMAAVQQQQQQQPFRPPPSAPAPPPPPPPSLVLPRTAVAVAPPAPFAPQPRTPSQQQRFPPTQTPTPPQPRQQLQRGPPPRGLEGPPRGPEGPPPGPALIVPRAGLMTVEERRAAFARAALRADASARAKELLLGAGGMAGGEQRTQEWHALRDARLTASAFGNALGFWPGGRAGLWEEKVGLGRAFAGNAATDWGTEAEPRALEAFVAVARLEDAAGGSPGAPSSGGRRRRRVSECRFEVLFEDDAHDWLGASPDGLIELEAGGGGGGRGGREGLPPSLSPAAAADGDDGGGETLDGGGGVLEIKCPFNRGRPLDASPWASPPHYYVPQVQGLLAITGREWCDLWCWTPARGAASFRFERDRGYWAQAFEVLADFWWAHVVPGNQAAAAEAARAGSGGAGAGGGQQLDLLQSFRPAEEHPLTRSIVRRSREMAERAAGEGARRFSAAELEEAIRRTA